MFDKSKILATTLNTKKIDVPKWGGETIITEFTVKEAATLENILFKGQVANDDKISIDMEAFNKQKLLAVSFGVVNTSNFVPIIL